MHDRLWDLRLSVRTVKGGIVPKGDSKNGDATECVPTGYFLLAKIFDRLESGGSEVFADYGCGSGRVVCFAACKPYKKVVGVELLKDVAVLAQENVLNMSGKKAPVEVVAGMDVVDFDPKEVTQFFMFNPFGAATMRAVLERVRSSLDEFPRKITIVYFNPVFESLLRDCDWLTERKDLAIDTGGGHRVVFFESI